MQNANLQGFQLSPQQKSLWLLQQEIQNCPYRSQGAVLVTGELDREKLVAVLANIVHRHEILRTRFEQLPGLSLPVQIIEPSITIPSLPSHDLSDLSPPEQQVRLESLFQQMLVQPLRLERCPNWQLALIQLGKNKHWLFLSLTALCGDRQSLENLVLEICYGYAGQPEKLVAEPLQYADFAEWQNELLEAEDTELGRKYWLDREKIAMNRFLLPFERSSVQKEEFIPETISLSLSTARVEQLEQLLQKLNVEPAVFFLAGLLVLIQRITRKERLTIGVKAFGRDEEELSGSLGLMAKYLPLNIDVDETQKLPDFCRQIAAQWQKNRQWQDYFNGQLFFAQTANTHNLFWHSLSFDYRDNQTPKYSAGGLDWSLEKIYSCCERYKLNISCEKNATEININFNYDRCLYKQDEIVRWASYYQTLLASALEKPSLSLSELELISSSETQALLLQFSGAIAAEMAQPSREVAQRLGLHQVFEQQVEKTPERIAVAHGGETLTYVQLNQRANQLARYLQNSGIGHGGIVAICVDRSPLMIIGLLAAWKVGAAYLPLDPSWPPERLALLLRESQAVAILTQESLQDKLPQQEAAILVWEPIAAAVSDCEGENLGLQVSPEDLAYVIYTSGSTGIPKGVAIEHRQLLNYLQGILAKLALPSSKASYGFISSFAADLGNTAIFPALCTGGCLQIIPQNCLSDPVALAAYCRQQGGIDCLKIVPSHLKALINNAPNPAQLLPRQRLILGGEACDWEFIGQLEALAPNCTIINHYGPTEATVGVLTYQIEPNRTETEGETVPLGKPLPNTQIFLLDSHLRPVPVGVWGELYIGGASLARGYLNQPQLNQQQFNANPFNHQLKIKRKPETFKLKISSGGWFSGKKFKLKSSTMPLSTSDRLKFKFSERLYRTGDLARYLPSGNIEFLGRADNQVKIRGFRVELGAIETILRQHPAIQETVVVAVEDEPGEKRLVAYFTSLESPAIAVGELRRYLQQKLPAFALPAALVRLEALPLTENGKLDRRALCVPAWKQCDRETSSIAPRTPQEKVLADIWAKVLRVGQVGIFDNFFELGGDSILSIQIVARAREAGLRLAAIAPFHYQTVAELAAVAQPMTGRTPQGEVVGNAPLTPIAHWFFAQQQPEPHHWNLSILLEIPAQLDRDRLEQIFSHLYHHHDALRLRFERQELGWQQSYGEAQKQIPCRWFDLSSLSPGEQASAIETHASQIQSSLDLSVPPLMSLAGFDLGSDRPGRLLVVCHHLIIDGISWGIWLEDFYRAYEQLESGETVQLPPKTTSFQEWAERLIDYARTETAKAEFNYWLANGSQSVSPLPKDDDTGANTVASARTVSVSLDAATTQSALEKVAARNSTPLHDLLLSSLLHTFGQWTGEAKLRLELEGHGRETLFEGVDLSRTLGWFTARFPVVFTLEIGERPSRDTLKSVKAQRQHIPNRGIGYGILRYLSGNPEIVTALEALPSPEVSFNYLGQYDRLLPQSDTFRLAKESRGAERSLRGTRTQAIAIEAIVLDGQLHVRWTYSENLHRRSTIETLAENFIATLKELIAQCLAPGDSYTPADFPLASLTPQQLASLNQTFAPLADIYCLSPLQQGLLFHSRYAPESRLYCQQKVFTLQGTLDKTAFKQAWHAVVNRHHSLKAAFVWENLDEPLQVIKETVDIPFEEQDWQNLSLEEQELKLHDYLKADLERGFSLSEAPLMRMALLAIASDRYQFVWSHHHLLLDGWCNSPLLDEVFKLHQAYRRDRALSLPDPVPYRHYLAWLQQQDRTKAKAFWQQTLSGIDAPTRWGIEQDSFGEARNPVCQQLSLAPETATALRSLARTHGLTLNILIQGALALLLSRYSGREDILFGATVSGRPAELPGVESAIGVFINTLPVRVRIPGDISLLSWLKQLQQQQTQRWDYQYNSLSEIQGWSDIPRHLPLFEIFIAFENYPIETSLLSGNCGLKILNVRSFSRTNYPFSVTVELTPDLSIAITYEPQKYEAIAIERILEQFQALLEVFPASMKVLLSQIDLIERTEIQELVDSFNVDLE
ncbi:non-ribosomal peptide synthetase [Oscillatoria salina]|uniref:non-ribosomal peptide synthetase n=1 Tax=Oscillatoria salina TaxID=331517 RepID=UPI001CCB4C2F|nr:non-ribosomal peptide synthetase [Oscillatoria salina]MBZ8183316.1 amino acid adenylation domain-containing protein [Oscillatoria salina IIICB1]